MNTVIRTRVDPRNVEELKKEAAEKGMTLSAYLRFIVKKRHSRPKTVLKA